MTGVVIREVSTEDSGVRLDRWFRRHYPDVSHAHLEKLLRSGQVRIDGRRAKAGERLAEGQRVRIPPLAGRPTTPTPVSPSVITSDAEARELAGRVVHCDDHIIVLDKPAGLAVQGGSQTIRHLDGMLDVLRFGGARPKLVHRLDRDTSGVLVLARTTATATALTRAFRTRAVRKLYWAVVVGVPKRPHGLIDLALAKTSSAGGEKMGAALDAKRRAVTRYRVVEAAGRRVAWLALEPLTGRTHQLRAHCAALGVPILGDGKYGGRAAFSLGNAVGRGLHLHAAAIVFPHPADGLFSAQAPLPQHMQQTWQQLGFSLRLADRETKRWIEETMTDPHRRCSQDHGDGSKAG